MNTDTLKWYGNVQKIIRGVAIFCCFIAKCVIKDNESDDFLEFNSRISPLDNSIHNNIFINMAREIDPYVTKITSTLLIVAIISLILAYLLESSCRKLSDVLHISGMLLSVGAGLSYILVYYFVGYATLTINLKSIFVCMLLILGFLITIQNIIFYIKNHQAFNALDVIYALLFVALIGGCTIWSGKLLSKQVGSDYKVTKEEYKLIKKHREGYSQDIAYQMGNVLSGLTYHNGYIYDYSSKAIFKINQEGVKQTICSAPRGSFSGGIYYYDGYLYTRIFDKEAEYSDTLIRVSTETGLLEELPIYKDIRFSGVADGKLYYALAPNENYETFIYYIDLNKPIKEDNAVLYDKLSGSISLAWDEWIKKYMYNYDKSSWFYGLNNDHQFIDDTYYYLFDTYDHEENYYNDPNSFSYNANCFLEICTPEKIYALIEYVVDFNIFNNTIYYAQESKTGYDIYSCDKDGNNKTQIATIPMNFVEDDYAYDFDIYMAEDFIWCVINHNLKDAEDEHWEYTISIKDGTIHEITLQ